jgi:CubicO group peptidase (beta-lactamase class C family)
MRTKAALLAACLTLTLPTFALAAEVPTAKPESVGLSSERLARIKPHFQKYVDEKELSGIYVMVARNGKVVYQTAVGHADIATKRPYGPDTIVRLASMTKPIAATALMILYEEGRFRLSEPVSKYIPELKGMKVFKEMGPDGKPVLVDAKHEFTIEETLNFSAGFSGYGAPAPVMKMWADAKLNDRETTLADMVRKMGKLPLAHQPGEGWLYGNANDVQLRLVEVLSGMTADKFLQERLFAPLGMVDTTFNVPADKQNRVATIYRIDPEKGLTPGAGTPLGDAKGPTKFFSGAGGLYSTAQDYIRYALMLSNGGEFEGKRILSRKTIELMATNHAPPGHPIIGDNNSATSEITRGYGYGFGVRTTQTKSAVVGSVGEFFWSGAFSTTFWVDPKEKIVGLEVTQRTPTTLPIGPDLHALIYSAFTD